MQADGSFRRGEAVVPSEDAEPTVVWGTPDLFDVGAPLHAFFAFVQQRAGSVRWFQSPSAGVDAHWFDGLRRPGLRLTTSHVNSVSVAEYVMGAVLEHFQQRGRWREAAARRSWEPASFRELYGSTWLVIGLGALGSAVAVRAQAFGVHVVGVRRRPIGDEPVSRVIGPPDLHEALPLADVVVVAAPSTAETRHLVDARFLAAMREGSLLVNVGRGSLLDEDALLAALERGIPEAAVLDVTATEPLPADSPLWGHPAVSVTPHSAGRGSGRYDRAADLFVTNLDRFLRGQPLLHELPPP
jgi:phosphoglycerate dehydrogenase-like enzyme